MIFRKHIISEEEARTLFVNEHSKFIEIDGINLHYRDEGQMDAQPIVLLHGLSASLHNWDSIMTPLTQKYRVLRMDIPGFGISGYKKDIDFEYLLVFMKQFLDRMGIKNAHVIGSSMGGWISWEFCLKFPEYVDKLVLMNSAGYFDKESKPPTYNLAKSNLFKMIIRRGAPKLFVKRILKNAYADKSKLSDDMINRYYKLVNRKGNLKNLGELVKQELNPSLDRINEIKNRTLIVWGGKDPVQPLRYGKQFHEEIANSELIVYRNVGHLPMEEVPEKVKRDLVKFLDAE
jgi:pimeloyl-ACP methyl ester carboxylesterase